LDSKKDGGAASLPQPVDVAKTVEAAKETAQAKATSKRAAVARSRTIFTSPLGLEQEAGIAKKTLLGQ
jgi:hypothetical protein